MMFEPKKQLLMNTFVEVDITIVSVRENSNLFILFEQRGKVLASIYQNFFNNVELSCNDFANICNKVWKKPYNYIVVDITKNKNINGKLRINWNRRVL